MTWVYAFLFAGTLCLLAQILYEYTRLTPGHITSIFVVAGVLLETGNVYDRITELCGGGAMTPIVNFGHLLAHAAVEGARDGGFLGILKNMLVPVSAILVFVVIISLLAALFSRPRCD